MLRLNITTTVEDAIRGLNDDEIVDVVAAGIDQTLGKGSSKLIFKTFESVFHFNVTSLLVKTGEFGVLLPKIIGEIAYHLVVRSILAEIDARKEKKDSHESH